jgi:hypothetical protein
MQRVNKEIKNDLKRAFILFGNELLLSSDIFTFDSHMAIHAFWNKNYRAGVWFREDGKPMFTNYCIGSFYENLDDDEKKIFLDELLNIYGSVFGFSK